MHTLFRSISLIIGKEKMGLDNFGLLGMDWGRRVEIGRVKVGVGLGMEV